MTELGADLLQGYLFGRPHPDPAPRALVEPHMAASA
jgi:EAL domain-containing protein (putative c-di-GMP-specific phosphodiesterase class I)